MQEDAFSPLILRLNISIHGFLNCKINYPHENGWLEYEIYPKIVMLGNSHVHRLLF